jgi:hypothetical protein
MREREATWVEPELLAEIESAGGKVRHPGFNGLRGGPLTDYVPRHTSRE